MKAAAVVIPVLCIIGLATVLYVESAESEAERAARYRGCLLCHTDSFEQEPLSCLQQWQHGTPLTPMVHECMLRAHPELPGEDAELLAHYITARQLPLLAAGRKTERGAALYAAKCATCHGKNGEGEPGNYPPLRGSEWLTPAPDRPSLRQIITEGLEGPIRVNGQDWNSTMLPPGVTDPQDVQLLIEHLQRFH